MIGCLFPLLLLFIGGAIGSVVGGTNGAYWGGGLGFFAGIAIFAVLFGMLARARHK